MIIEGWYIPEQLEKSRQRRFPRWVLGEIGGKVCYSKGGNDHYFCLRQTFINWVKRTRAEFQRHASASPK